MTVAEELNFQHAADRLFVSQSLLSKQVRQLESELQLQLFERTWRTVALTAAGRALLPAARDLVRAWDEAQRTISHAVAEDGAVLTVGLSTSVGRGLLQSARIRLKDRHPGWRLQYRHMNWDDATAGLASSQVDVAFAWLPIPDQDRYGVRVVARESRSVAVHAGHPLAARSEVAFEELLDEPFLALPASAGPLRDHWLAVDERGGRPPRIAATVHNVEETLSAVARGTGIVLLSEGNAALYRRPGIAMLPVTGLPPSHLAVVWRSDDNRAVVRDLIAACNAD